MSFSVSDTIRSIGVDKLAAAAGIPERTLYRWYKNNRVPGKGVVYELRLQHLKAAILKLQAPKAKKRKAA